MFLLEVDPFRACRWTGTSSLSVCGCPFVGLFRILLVIQTLHNLELIKNTCQAKNYIEWIQVDIFLEMHFS